MRIIKEKQVSRKDFEATKRNSSKNIGSLGRLLSREKSLILNLQMS
jgi:hypothetical protein